MGTATFWERTEHHCLSQDPGANFFTRSSSVPFLNIPAEILSGYEDGVSSSQDRHTTWVKADTVVTSERRMVDVQKAVEEHREAAVRRQESTTREHFFDTNVPNRSSVQKRLSIFN